MVNKERLGEFRLFTGKKERPEGALAVVSKGVRTRFKGFPFRTRKTLG